MSATFDAIINEMLTGAITTIFNLLKVLIPLMIIVEILMVYKIIEKVATKLEGFGKIMGMSKNAVFPLLVAVFMGVTYGAGTIIEINKRTPLSRKDMALVAVFMYLCHGIIETGFLFYVAGANVLVVTLGRLFFALIVTMIAARLPYFKNMEN
ncbi:MAG: hypothetical protein JJE17_12525 [Peptostreptococcaceae bacterium]|nr:hypothetical protein [Peptostreptococcaceae bacterium]